jgi:EpsI family protein
MKLHKHFAIAMIILAFSAVLSAVYFRWLVGVGAAEAVPLAKPLSSIPAILDDWESDEQQIRPDVLMKIGSKDILRRRYHRGKQALEVYIVYFGGVRGTAPHSPEVCMPGGGWSNIDPKIVPMTLPGFGDEPLNVHQDVFENKKGEKRLVIWWEYVHGRNVTSHTLQRLLWALPPFLGGKRGSILQVQIAYDYRGDASVAKAGPNGSAADDGAALIGSFMNLFGPHIRDVLPGTTEQDSL